MKTGNIPNIDGIKPEWVALWNEIENWYGDVKKSETGKEFITRMQSKFKLQKEPSLPDTDSELRVACYFWNLIQDHYTGFTYGDKRTENDTLNRIAADIKEIKARFAQSAAQEAREAAIDDCVSIIDDNDYRLNSLRDHEEVRANLLNLKEKKCQK